jgi:uncharacterized protein RhaS with RHS repeats
MKKLSEALTELGIDFTFPIKIKGSNGNVTYHENSNGIWWKYEYDANGNQIYCKDSSGYWSRSEYDANGNQTYYENIDGYIEGKPRSRSCDSKIIEVDGKKYKLTAL